MLKIRRTFISSKYLSMLLSGTVLMVLTALMSVADTLIAGILLGEDAVTGICLVLPVYSLASFFAVAFSYGVPILYAGKMGSFEKKEADTCFGVGLSVVLVIGIMMFLAIVLFGEAYLRSFQPGGQIYASAAEYLGWLKYAVLLLPLNELLDGMVFTDGDEQITLASNITRGLLKVVLSVVLCRIMGAKGLAAASLITFVISICITGLHFLRPGNTLKLNLAFSPGIFREMVKFGIVDASTHLFVSLFSFSINFFVKACFGPRLLILVSVITMLKEGQILFEGIGEAITPIISVYLGEETWPGVRKVWKLARLSEFFESLLSTCLLLVFAEYIVSLLGIEDAATFSYAVWGLRMLSLTLFFTCRMFLDSSYFILVDRVKLGVFDSLLRELFPALPMALLGGMLGGVYGMFSGLMLAPLLGYLLSVLYIRLRYGRENYPLFLKEKEQMHQSSLFEFPVRPDSITRTREKIGDTLKKQGCSEALVNRTMLIFEELFMLMYEANPGRTVLAECAVQAGENIRMISKDNGRLIDLTDTEQDVHSLRAYILSNMLRAHTDRRTHLLVLSYNRIALEIR